MSKKETLDAIFRLTPNPDGTIDFEDKNGWLRFCENFKDIQFLAEFKQEALLSEKRKMYNMLHGPVLDAAIIMYTEMGYEGCDKVKAKYLLKAEFAKSYIFNTVTKTHVPCIIDLSDMSKNRLLKFLSDCLFFLESNGIKIPDSEQYKEMLQKKIEKKRDDLNY